MNVANYITSVIRTFVPALWGTAIAWLVGRGIVDGQVAESFVNDGAVFLVTVTIGGYYALARWLETRTWVPPWLSAILLGTKTVPAYLTQYAAGLTKAVPVAADSPAGRTVTGSTDDELDATRTYELTESGTAEPTGAGPLGDQPTEQGPRHHFRE